LSDDQHPDLLRTVETITNLVAAAQTEEAAQAEERGPHARQGGRDVAVVLGSTLRVAPAEAKRRVRVARALPQLPKTRQALHGGVISAQHALAITNTVERIPAERSAEAEELLCDHAPRLTPQQLTQAGKLILAQLDPDGVYRDEHEGRNQRSLRMYKDQNGWLCFTGHPATGAGCPVRGRPARRVQPPPRRGQEGPTHC
jgi:hypothetical protein